MYDKNEFDVNSTVTVVCDFTVNYDLVAKQNYKVPNKMIMWSFLFTTTKS